jgi:hypothetical protein
VPSPTSLSVPLGSVNSVRSSLRPETKRRRFIPSPPPTLVAEAENKDGVDETKTTNPKESVEVPSREDKTESTAVIQVTDEKKVKNIIFIIITITNYRQELQLTVIAL